MFIYLVILLVLLLLTLILEKTQHIHLYHNQRESLEITVLFFIVAVIWDTFAIWQGHWVFPAGNNLGIAIGLMPL